MYNIVKIVAEVSSKLFCFSKKKASPKSFLPPKPDLWKAVTSESSFKIGLADTEVGKTWGAK